MCLEIDRDGTVRAVVAAEAGAMAGAEAGIGAFGVPVAFHGGGAAPAVVSMAPGPDRPRYPTAARIANAYRPDLVDVLNAAELGLDAAALAPDYREGGLVLGPERTLGQTLSGSTGEAAEAVLEILAGSASPDVRRSTGRTIFHTSSN